MPGPAPAAPPAVDLTQQQPPSSGQRAYYRPARPQRLQPDRPAGGLEFDDLSQGPRQRLGCTVRLSVLDGGFTLEGAAAAIRELIRACAAPFDVEIILRLLV